MACGNFELNLDPSSPRSIVENIPTWSTICITPGRCDGLSRAEVLAQATYSGILRSRTDNLCTLRGPSIMAWLGDEDGKGPTYTRGDVDGTTSGQDMIDTLFGPTIAYTNGLTLGTYSSLPATPVWADYINGGTDQEVPRVFMDRICRCLNWQYRVNADGTVDFSDDGSIFTSGSVVVLADHLGEPISDVIRVVVSGKVRATASDDDFANMVYVYDGTYGGFGTFIGTDPKGFDPSSEAYIAKHISGTDVGSDANAEAQASVELLTNYATKNLIDVSIRLDDPRTRICPGDTIYVYDPLQGLYSLGTQLDIMGQVIFPITVDVSEMTWPITEGMGVYALLQGTTTVWDLSEYVLWGSGDTNLKVGAKWPTLREVVQGRN